MAIYINSKGENVNVEEMDNNHLLNAFKKMIVFEREGLMIVPGIIEHAVIEDQIKVLKEEIFRRMDNK